MADTKKPDPDNGPDSSPDTTLPGDDALLAVVDADTTEAPDTDTSDGNNQAAPGTENPVQAPVSLGPASNKSPKAGVFVAALIGGVLAALLVLFAARTEILDSILPGAANKSEAAEMLATLRDADLRKTEELAALNAEIAKFEQPDLRPITALQATFQADIALLRANMDAQQAFLRDLESRLVALDARLVALEMRPMTEAASEAAIAAYDRELAALQQAMAVQRADVEAMIEAARATEDAARTLEENAVGAAQNAQNQATFARLLGALENGAAYAPVLQELLEAGVAVPAALTASADDGVATLAALGEAYPASARAALAAARADAGEGGGLGGFLQRQLGARSVSPRQGDDPDAILSRAEAAVIAGELTNALEEIATLPDAARAEMRGWADTATARLKTLQAADELAQNLNNN